MTVLCLSQDTRLRPVGFQAHAMTASLKQTQTQQAPENISMNQQQKNIYVSAITCKPLLKTSF